MKLGPRLNAIRKENKLTAASIAKSCGVSRSYITLIEKGKRLPSPKVLPKLAKTLDISTPTLLEWYIEDFRTKLMNLLQGDDDQSIGAS